MSLIFSRRKALGAAALGLAGLAVPVWAKTRLAIPPHPMRLKRRLERPLRDGKFITVNRAWIVSFERFNDRIAITGRQESVLVDAPSKLAEFARLEEQRNTDKMFPIILAGNGSIVSAGRGDDTALVEDAYAAGQRAIDLASISDEHKRDAQTGLKQIRQAGDGFLATLPKDLFFPTQNEIRHNQEFALNEGVRGTLELVYRATHGDSFAWLAKAEREVITTIGPSRRISREIWSLTPA